MKRVSVVLPCFNESKNLPLLIPEIIENVPKKYDYEIILVDDGSYDSTAEVIQKLAEKNKKIKGLILHRRFGHQAALMAGVEQATGDATITMDSDFQHPPELLPKLISLWEDGHDLVLPKKLEDKTRNPLYLLGRGFVYKLWAAASDGALIPGVADFRLMDKKILGFIKNSSENQAFIRGLVSLAARSPKVIHYSPDKRRYGTSAYTLRSLIDVFVTGFISFSTKPLRLASVFGLFIAIATTLFLAVDILHALTLGKRIIPGWTTVVLLILILNGFTIFYLGIIGEYLGVVFREVKKRPKYLIDRTINI